MIPNRRPARYTLTAAIAIVASGTAIAADTERSNPLEPADTSSPRATLLSFLEACNEIHNAIQLPHFQRSRTSYQSPIIQRAIRCLDLSEEPDYLRDYVASEATVCLKEVLDRIPLPEIDTIPNKKEAEEANDGRGLARWSIPDTEIFIHLVEEGPRRGAYLFTPQTVTRAREFYERVEHMPYQDEPLEGFGPSPGFLEWFLSEPGWVLNPLIDRLPEWTRRRVLGQAIWQWVGLVVTVVLGLMVMILAYVVGRRRAQTVGQQSVLRYWVTLWFPVAAMLVPLVVRDFVSYQIRITGPAVAIVEFTANIIFLLAALVVLMSAGNRIAEVLIASPKIHPRGLDAQFIRITCRVLSLVAATIVFLEGGRYLGIPITTLLAGAGVGGLAVALAAQDTLKNLFGSMMIILDRPYRVGERIAVKQYDGVVEEIGLRSTKIRLLTGHVASIPNEEMARSDVENIGRRKHIRRIADLSIPLDTSPEKSEQAVRIVRKILSDHDGMSPEFPPRVFLNEFNRDALNLRMIYWYHPPDYWEFLAFSERVNLDIKRQFAAEGIEFALPTSTTYMAQDREHPLELKMLGEEDAAK